MAHLQIFYWIDSKVFYVAALRSKNTQKIDALLTLDKIEKI